MKLHTLFPFYPVTIDRPSQLVQLLPILIFFATVSQHDTGSSDH